MQGPTTTATLIVWTHLFTLASYVAAMLCVYAGVVHGAKQKRGPRVAIARQLSLFAFFVFMLWFLEAWAQFRTPFYAYSMKFGDMLPLLRSFKNIEFLQKTARHDACTDLVGRIQAQTGYGIPLSVVLLEASLTYAGYRASRAVHPNIIAQPFLAGLCVFIVDVLLDPIVAVSRGCEKDDSAIVWNGVGLWHWYVPNNASEGEALAGFFHIPLYNFAAWLGGPIAIVALANLLRLVWEKWRGGGADEEAHTTHGGWGFVLVFLVVIYLLYSIAPNSYPSPAWQAVLLGVLVLVAVLAFFREFGTFKRGDDDSPVLAGPAVLSIVILLVIGTAEGWFVSRPELLLVLAVVAPGTLWLAWLPHYHALQRFVDLVSAIDAFVRLHYFGFTAMLLLLGAATTNGQPDTFVVVGLLALGACFHTYAYVMNDLKDLPLDRQNPLRKFDPLVSGKIQPEAAWGLVIAVVPAAFATLLSLRTAATSETLLSSCDLCLLLAAAGTLMVVYNIWGKVCPQPWVTDLAQGVAWGLLALIGALVVPRASLDLPREKFDLMARTLPLFVYGTAFICLINGIHGGLRDLKTDRAAGHMTTAIWLGGTADGPTDDAQSTVSIGVFAHTVHLVLFGAVGFFLLKNQGEYSANVHWWVSGALLVVLAVSTYLLCGVVRRTEPRRQWFISAHLFWLMLPPMIAFGAAQNLSLAFRLAVPVCVFLPLLTQRELLEFVLRHAYDPSEAPEGGDAPKSDLPSPSSRDERPTSPAAGSSNGDAARRPTSGSVLPSEQLLE